MTNAGLGKLRLGGWEQAVAWFRRPIEANRNYPLAYFHLDATLAQLGRLDEAHAAVKAGLTLNPAFAISAPAPIGRRLATTRRIWPSSSRFSKACARPESPNNDCRLAAILPVGVDGYSRLMGEDEEVTARRFANTTRRKVFPTRSL